MTAIWCYIHGERGAGTLAGTWLTVRIHEPIDSLYLHSQQSLHHCYSITNCPRQEGAKGERKRIHVTEHVK